ACAELAEVRLRGGVELSALGLLRHPVDAAQLLRGERRDRAHRRARRVLDEHEVDEAPRVLPLEVAAEARAQRLRLAVGGVRRALALLPHGVCDARQELGEREPVAAAGG